MVESWRTEMSAIKEAAVPGREGKWSFRNLFAACDHAFQPIVDVHTGACIGVEALLRGWEEGGFSSIHAVFDAAASAGILSRVDSQLCRRRPCRRAMLMPRRKRAVAGRGRADVRSVWQQ